MKFVFSVLFSVLFFNAMAAEPMKVSSEIKTAKVYLRGALLSNSASAQVPAGKSALLFTGLSYDVLRESIRIKPEGCRILSVSLKKNYLDLELLSKEIQKLKDEQTKLSEYRKDKQDELTIYAEEKQMILTNKSIGGEDGVDPEQLKLMADFFRARLMDILSKEQAIRGDLAKTDKRMAELTRQINESAQKNIYPSSEIEVSIQADRAGTAKFEIEYFINEAGWFPSYDFRVTDLNSPLQMDYLASVYQNSGHDWKNLEITLSSTDPGANSGIPVVKPWYINQQNYRLSYDVLKPLAEQNKAKGIVTDQSGQPIPYAAVRVENSSVGTSTDFEGRFNLSVPPGTQRLIVSAIGYENQSVVLGNYELRVVLNEQTKMLESVVIASSGTSDIESRRQSAAPSPNKTDYKKEALKQISSNVNEGGTTVSIEYTLKEKQNIPSDGRPYSSQIMQREVLAGYRHEALPKLSKEAYLSLFIPEWEKLNLLEGEVNLYFGNAYSGKSVISLANLSDSLVFSMGKNPNLKISRNLLSQKTTGGGILPNKESAYRWETEIRNTGSGALSITITEPFPISVEKEIKVELAKELSGAQIDKDKGLLTWEITLQPGEQRKLEFGFSVTYPKALNMRFE